MLRLHRPYFSFGLGLLFAKSCAYLVLFVSGFTTKSRGDEPISADKKNILSQTIPLKLFPKSVLGPGLFSINNTRRPTRVESRVQTSWRLEDEKT